MNLPPKALDRWAHGIGGLTDFQFLRLVDLLEEITPPALPAAGDTAPPDAPKVAG